MGDFNHPFKFDADLFLFRVVQPGGCSKAEWLSIALMDTEIEEQPPRDIKKDTH